MSGTSTVDTLFTSLNAGEFARDYYLKRPCVAHGPLQRVEGRLRGIAWTNPAALVESLVGGAVIGYSRTVEGRARQAVYPRAMWRDLYARGATVELTASETPGVRALCDAVALDLGLASARVSADAFISPRGEAVPKHFDSVDVIALQLHGTKRWLVAENTQLRFPAHAFIPGFGPDIRNHRDAATDGPTDYSVEMPATAEQIRLTPGSVLFVPRGYWHQTFAETDSISLSFVTRPPVVGEIVRALLDRNVSAQSQWREPVVMREETLGDVRGKLARLVEQLRGQVSATDGPGMPAIRRLKRSSEIEIRVGAGRETRVVTVVERGSPRMQLEVPAYVGQLFEAVGMMRDAFAPSELFALFPPGADDWVESTLKLMQKQGVVVEVSS